MTNPNPGPPHWMKPKPKRIAIIADDGYDHDPVVQYAILRWWAQHEFPLLHIYRRSRAGVLGRIETLVQGDRIQVSDTPQSHQPYALDGVLVFIDGRGSRGTRRQLRWHRANGTEVTVYRVGKR